MLKTVPQLTEEKSVKKGLALVGVSLWPRSRAGCCARHSRLVALYQRRALAQRSHYHSQRTRREKNASMVRRKAASFVVSRCGVLSADSWPSGSCVAGVAAAARRLLSRLRAHEVLENGGIRGAGFYGPEERTSTDGGGKQRTDSDKRSRKAKTEDHW